MLCIFVKFQLENLSGKVTSHYNIGTIYQDEGIYSGPLKRFEEALETLIKIGLSESPNIKLLKKKIKIIKSDMK